MPKGIPKNGVNKGWFILGSKLTVKEKEQRRETALRYGPNKGCFKKGQKLSEITKLKISKALLGNKYAFGKKHKGIGGHPQTLETRKKISVNLSKAKLGVPQLHMRGERNNHWKGGVTPLHQKIRGSLEYKKWRRDVFVRDNWTCILCGQRGGALQADHIKPFSLFPALRFDLNNGRTLCILCHKQTDTYMWKINTYQQFPTCGELHDDIDCRSFYFRSIKTKDNVNK